jgi:hypothetical protein
MAVSETDATGSDLRSEVDQLLRRKLKWLEGHLNRLRLPPNERRPFTISLGEEDSQIRSDWWATRKRLFGAVNQRYPHLTEVVSELDGHLDSFVRLPPVSGADEAAQEEDFLAKSFQHGLLVDRLVCLSSLDVGAVGDPLSPDDDPEAPLPSATGGKPINSPQSQPEWPPDSGWHFRPGEAAFNRVPFVAQGAQAKTLSVLVLAKGPVEWTKIAAEVSPDTDIDQKTVRGYVSHARKILRDTFKLDPNVDPLPCVEQGNRTAWKLDAKVLIPKSS